MIEVYKKNEFSTLCFGLTSREFGCRCDDIFCRALIVSAELIRAYYNFRCVVSTPLKINSGFRCTAHNYCEGGTALSRHLTGEAIDISLETIEDLDSNDIRKLALKSGFTFVKFYKSFVHLDVRQTKEKSDGKSV